MEFIELCSGAGGLSKGFIKCGFKPILLNDIDKYCIETLKKNHPNVSISNKCMTEIDLNLYKNIDILMGGVPCQSFSYAGKRKGLEDKRGNLLIEFIKIVKNICPKIFIIENVKGLYTHCNGTTFKKIYDEIENTNNYNIYSKVLNSNDYGVPQNRERLFIVGVSKNIKKEFKFPEKLEYKPVLRDVLENCPTSDGIEYSEKKKKLFELIPEGGCWVDLPLEMQKTYLGKSFESGGGKRGILKRLHMDKPCLTLLTTPSQKQTERCHPKKTRPLQILEYARIQTFPDDYKFCGSLNQKYKQIGNAVPVNLAYNLAKEIKKLL